MSANEGFDAIIIGAGHNGLVAASYLAKSGAKVLMIERSERVGGACSTEELYPGWKFPGGAHISHVLQDKIVDELQLRKFGLEIYPIDPKCFVPFSDGRYFTIWNDSKKTSDSLERISRHDGQAYAKWEEFWTSATKLIRHFYFRSPPTLSELVDKAKEFGSETVLHRLLNSSMDELVDEYFNDEFVKGFFANFGTDLGDPRAPGTPYAASMFAVSTTAENYGIVKGSMGSIPESIARVAESYGVRIMKNCEVDKVIIGDGRAKGVRLKDGRIFESKAVISNADPKRTFLKLVERENLDKSFLSGIERLKTRSASLKLLCALSELPDFSKHLGVNFDPKMIAEIAICPTVAEQSKNWEDALEGRPTRNPVLWINIPTIYDKTIAPPGKHVISVYLQYAPSKPKNGSWNDLRETEAEFIIDFLSGFAPNFRKSIIHWSLSTPDDLEKKMYLTNGNIRHIDMIPGQLGSLRFLPGWSDYRTPIAGLYLCGAGTHPGGEVTCAPGHNAAQEVLKDLKVSG